MSEHRARDLVGAIAVYSSPDALAAGIDRAKKAGFRWIDAVTPYPVHGIDALLERRPSLVGVVALIAGLTGTALGKGFQWWISAYDYPLNIGGKPLFSWPAFIPVTFEMMVLFSAIATTFGMIALFNRLPSFRSSLLDSKFMPDLTTDKFGLVVDARDPLFQPERINGVLGGDGSLGIEMLYRNEYATVDSQRVVSPLFVAFVAVVALASIVTTHVVVKYTGETTPWNFMKHQPRLDAESLYPLFPDSVGMLLPVAGTVARGHVPFMYASDPEGAGSDLVNPVPFTEKNLERGRAEFETYCRPCHGPRAEGNKTLTAAFPNPPTLHSNKVRNWSDGRIYYVITMGQNVMPSYASQISPADRWRIIHYLRALQRSRNAPERDVK